jgi:hypothetical protein
VSALLAPSLNEFLDEEGIREEVPLKIEFGTSTVA